MLSAGALAGLLRLPWLDIGVAAVNGLLLGLLVQLAERRPRTKEALEAIAATVAAFVVLGVAAAAFVATLAAVPMLGADLIPQLAQDRFEMTVKLPPGTPLAQTDALVRELQAKHSEDNHSLPWPGAARPWHPMVQRPH